MRHPDLQALLLCPGEVADALGVGLAAVSNYRKRHPSFPTPAYVDPGGRARAYWRDDIDEWLATRQAESLKTADKLEQRAKALTEQAARLRNL